RVNEEQQHAYPAQLPVCNEDGFHAARPHDVIGYDAKYGDRSQDIEITFGEMRTGRGRTFHAKMLVRGLLVIRNSLNAASAPRRRVGGCAPPGSTPAVRRDSKQARSRRF